MNIEIRRGEGISQAIKRELIANGVQENEIKGSIWSKIQQTLKEDANTEDASKLTHNGSEKKIGELWSTLNTNVKTYVGDVLTISQATWAKIMKLFGAEPKNKDEKVEVNQQKPAENDRGKKEVKKPSKNEKTPQVTPQQETKDDGEVDNSAAEYYKNKIKVRLKDGAKYGVNEKLDKAAELVSNIACMKTRPEIKTEGDNRVTARLSDGRSVTVAKGSDGVYIYVNTNEQDDINMGTPEVTYKITSGIFGIKSLHVDVRQSVNSSELAKDDVKVEDSYLTKGTRIKELLFLVERIFGDKLPNGVI